MTTKYHRVMPGASSHVGMELVTDGARRCHVLGQWVDSSGATWIVAGRADGTVGFGRLKPDTSIVPVSDRTLDAEALMPDWRASYSAQMAKLPEYMAKMQAEHREAMSRHEEERKRREADDEAEKRRIINIMNYKAGVRREILRLVGRK